jgi:hypothetical protein
LGQLLSTFRLWGQFASKIEGMSDGTTGKATLIATFYCNRDKEGVEQIHRRLYQALASSPQTTIPDDWQDPATATLLRRFNPPAAHDTAIVQLALNASGTTAGGWESMCRHLEDALEVGKDDALHMDGFWGYTLIYQAALTPGADADWTLNNLLPVIKRLGSSESLKEPLTHADMSGGRAWLMEIPVEGDGVAAATVYVALGSSDKEREFVRETLYGPDAVLLMPDLIAHKGYHQMRQYRGGDVQNKYEASLDDLREPTGKLLGDLREQTVETGTFDNLALKYNDLARVVPALNELRISLARQLHNYDRWQAQLEDNDVVDYHRDHLETATQELELMVAEGRDALEVADKAVAMAQVQIDKAQERGQRRTQTLLAVLAVALAVPQLVNQEAANALIELDYSTLLLVGVQTLITLGVAVLVAIIVKWFIV